MNLVVDSQQKYHGRECSVTPNRMKDKMMKMEKEFKDIAFLKRIAR